MKVVLKSRADGAGVAIFAAYAFQDLSSIPAGYTVPNGRTKPWGTGQAVLAAKDLIHEPFAVINADDYYCYFAMSSLSQKCNSVLIGC